METMQGSRLHTGRLELAILRVADAEALQKCADDRAIADTMISVPHPFTRQDAAAWVQRAAEGFDSGNAYHWGVYERQSKTFAGFATIRDRDRAHNQAELSFWVCRDLWGKGYATEACAAVLNFAFARLHINRIYAFRMVRNPASGRVLEHLGFQREGVLRQRVIKWGKYEDVVLAALLREDWEAAQKNIFRQ